MTETSDGVVVVKVDNNGLSTFCSKESSTEKLYIPFYRGGPMIHRKVLSVTKFVDTTEVDEKESPGPDYRDFNGKEGVLSKSIKKFINEGLSPETFCLLDLMITRFGQRKTYFGSLVYFK